MTWLLASLIGVDLHTTHVDVEDNHGGVAEADRVAHAGDFYALAHGVDPYDDADIKSVMLRMLTVMLMRFGDFLGTCASEG